MQTICSMAAMPIPGSRTLRRRRPRNVKALATIAKDGFGFLLMAVGLIAVFYFALRLSDKRKNG